MKMVSVALFCVVVINITWKEPTNRVKLYADPLTNKFQQTLLRSCPDTCLHVKGD